ncbi:hypothetical protein EMIHUDRAFT_446475 [Emiliania huxleyi CCMP1516]|uniref:Uncharacterized protein n=2 Tax=Emiliania huxleyi TaxID=2903 RepID=A0A0D3I5W6_EMIH1|nr:hypothetical protein EMIHUDRAFT_446475 [Emiliania huxleyi CCMP1516]EOD06651.1 hypothetical protein EMIHUDRAFT_446475 [Emiliania huxleyi CCMP1516]|eukprot:XP_005759080.1 hypothetical protein EMIHUDRAFT_446475 [Emiliania huxleyi CCMP1516]
MSGHGEWTVRRRSLRLLRQGVHPLALGQTRRCRRRGGGRRADELHKRGRPLRERGDRGGHHHHVGGGGVRHGAADLRHAELRGGRGGGRGAGRLLALPRRLPSHPLG